MGVIRHIVKIKEGENPWVKYIRNQVLKNNNCINSIWIGPPGSGKSWGMLSLFYSIDPDFNVNEDLFFKASKLMKNIKEGNFKRGKIFGYDEAGIDLHNLRYFDEINRGLNAFLQTARHRNYVFGFTVPYSSLVSKGVRMLMNMECRAEGWTAKNETKVKARVLEYNGDLNKFYRKRLIIKENQRSVFCNTLFLPKPPKHIVIEYEKLKKEFTSNLFDDISSKMSAYEMKQRAEIEVKGLTSSQREVIDLLKEGFNVEGIANKLMCSIRNVNQIMRAASKRGIKIEPIRDVNKRILRYNVLNDINSLEKTNI